MQSGAWDPPTVLQHLPETDSQAPSTPAAEEEKQQQRDVTTLDWSVCVRFYFALFWGGTLTLWGKTNAFLVFTTLC